MCREFEGPTRIGDGDSEHATGGCDCIEFVDVADATIRVLGIEGADSAPINLTSKMRAMPDGIFATSKDAGLVFH